jgi:hypothetical protein
MGGMKLGQRMRLGMKLGRTLHITLINKACVYTLYDLAIYIKKEDL